MSIIINLYNDLQLELRACHTSVEKLCCEAIAGKYIREKANQISANRELTGKELFIATKYGFKNEQH